MYLHTPSIKEEVPFYWRISVSGRERPTRSRLLLFVIEKKNLTPTSKTLCFPKDRNSSTRTLYFVRGARYTIVSENGSKGKKKEKLPLSNSSLSFFFLWQGWFNVFQTLRFDTEQGDPSVPPSTTTGTDQTRTTPTIFRTLNMKRTLNGSTEQSQSIYDRLPS